MTKKQYFSEIVISRVQKISERTPSAVAPDAQVRPSP